MFISYEMPRNMFWFEACLNDSLRMQDAAALLKKNKSDHVLRVAGNAHAYCDNEARKSWEKFREATL